MLESPRRGDSNKYPRHMFLEILNTILFNFSNNPFHIEIKMRSIQNDGITSFSVISNVDIKRVDSTSTTVAVGFYSRSLKEFWGKATELCPLLDCVIYISKIRF